jgi:recombinational DNA repair protein (RecF pathway)
MQLDHEHGTRKSLSPDAIYVYLPESGPIPRESLPATSEEPVSGAALLALKSGKIGEQHLPELKRLMRKLIRYYLGDREIKSQSLFN